MTRSDFAQDSVIKSEERRYREVDVGFLVFVCGPSTVGKSSFIRQLLFGALPSEIQGRFPREAGTWERVEPKRFVSLAGVGTAGLPRFKPGLIFHYDTMRIHNRGWDGYGKDRALDILYSARRIIVADLRAPAAVLETNWLSRVARQRPQRRLRRLIKAVKGAILHRDYVPETIIRKGDFSTLECYRNADWVDQAYAAWDAFLAEVPRSVPSADVEIMRIESRPCLGHEPTFHLRELPVGQSREQ